MTRARDKVGWRPDTSALTPGGPEPMFVVALPAVASASRRGPKIGDG